METNNTNQKVKKAAIVFWINLIISAIAFAALMKSISGNNEYRLIAAAIGFTGLFCMTFLVFVRLMKLQKAAKS